MKHNQHLSIPTYRHNIPDQPRKIPTRKWLLLCLTTQILQSIPGRLDWPPVPTLCQRRNLYPPSPTTMTTAPLASTVVQGSAVLWFSLEHTQTHIALKFAIPDRGPTWNRTAVDTPTGQRVHAGSYTLPAGTRNIQHSEGAWSGRKLLNFQSATYFVDYSV